MEDPLCSKLIKYFEDQEKKELPQEVKDIVFEDGILYKLDLIPRQDSVLGYRVIIPNIFIGEILNYYHCALPNGHHGAVKTFQHIHEKYFWKDMQRDIYQYISNCDTCLRNKMQKNK